MPKWIKCIWSHEIKFGTIDPFPLFQKVTSSYEPSLIIIDQFKKEKKFVDKSSYNNKIHIKNFYMYKKKTGWPCKF